MVPNGGFFYERGKTGSLEAYGISMFHQLHCLAMIRVALQEHDVHKRVDISNFQEARSGQQDHIDMTHVTHCLDYIRQVGLL